MAAGTIDRPTLSDTEPPKKGYVVERARVPLFLKLFGVTALLIAIVIAIAIGITLQRARRVAEETVRTSIAGAANLFRDFEKQRLASLTLATELTGNDPAFVA
jgi:ABC-type proline/glycine betaine transport system permease subunit